MIMNRIIRVALLAVLGLGGCTTLPGDLGRGDVDALTGQRGQFSAAAESEQQRDDLIRQLTAAPLSAEDAVRITLLNNAELQASYARLGFAAADVYAAGRMRNPVLAVSSLDPDVAGAMNQLTLGLAASFTDLITLPARKRLSEASFAAMKASIGAEVMHKAVEAEGAWYGYAGAQQVEALRRQLALAADLSAQLAERYFAAGNLNARDLALERAVASEARLEVLDAAAHTARARTELALVLGLSSGDDWATPAELRLPLEQEDELEALISLAGTSRLDLLAARAQTDLLADQLGVVNWTRWLGNLELGVERERETDGTRLTGPTLAWEIPVFNQNKDQQLRSAAALKAQIAEVQRLSNAVDNQVRLAHADVLNASARVNEYRNVLIPQRMETVARAQEEVNFMLIGVFELLAIKQQEYATYQAYLETIRDYWLARARLAMAVGGTLPSSQFLSQSRIQTEDLLQAEPRAEAADTPDTEEPDHSGHHMHHQGDQP